MVSEQGAIQGSQGAPDRFQRILEAFQRVPGDTNGIPRDYQRVAAGTRMSRRRLRECQEKVRRL